jgi:hypothetical protein
MRIFTHTFDYLALGILIACMVGAAARLLWPGGSSRQRQATERKSRK